VAGRQVKKFKTRRRTAEERYIFNNRKQQKKLEDFLLHEAEWAENLLLWYRIKKIDVPYDEYRGCAYFINKEYEKKPGSLTLLYKMYLQCRDEQPEVTKENAFDILRYNFKMYSKVLTTGGYGG
jgi:hypothetical protein